MRKLELTLCALLALGALGHLAGTLVAYEPGSEVFIWSLSGTAFVLLLVFVHVLRVHRPGDRPLRAAAIVASIVWIGLALGFGAAIGNVADQRALIHAIVTLGLLITTLMGARRAASGGHAVA